MGNKGGKNGREERAGRKSGKKGRETSGGKKRREEKGEKNGGEGREKRAGNIWQKPFLRETIWRDFYYDIHLKLRYNANGELK